MQRRAKILIIIGVLILIGLAGLWASKFFIAQKKVSWKTPSGEEIAIAMPKIPGMGLVSEEKTECSYRADYLYTLMKDADASDNLKEILKNYIQKREDWQLKEDKINEDGSYTLGFISQRSGAPEILTFNTNFEKGKGTSLALFYQWPPCSYKAEEEKAAASSESQITEKELSSISSTEKEKSLNIGEIPGARFDFEKRTECSQQLGYVYESYKDRDIATYLKDSLKQILIGQGLKLGSEKIEDDVHILGFSTDAENEKVILQIGFEQGKGNYFTFDYQWPPCHK